MITITTPTRGIDRYGSGKYKASRKGKDNVHRVHNGIDYSAAVNSIVHSPIAGVVSKIGYVYEEDLQFRYIQISDYTACEWRLFYVSPYIQEGQRVKKNDIIGVVQDLNPRYPGITNHVHVEIKNEKGIYINPMKKKMAVDKDPQIKLKKQVKLDNETEQHTSNEPLINLFNDMPLPEKMYDYIDEIVKEIMSDSGNEKTLWQRFKSIFFGSGDAKIKKLDTPSKKA